MSTYLGYEERRLQFLSETGWAHEAQGSGLCTRAMPAPRGLTRDGWVAEGQFHCQGEHFVSLAHTIKFSLALC